MTTIYAHFADVLGRLPNLSSPAQIWVTVKEFAAQVGYTHLAGADAARLSGGASDAIFYTDAPMIPGEIDRAYTYASAPFVQRALHSPEPFLISSLRTGPESDEPWFKLMADVVKRGEAVAVPVYNGDEPLAGFIFAGDKPDTSAPVRAMLQVLAHAAFAR